MNHVKALIIKFIMIAAVLGIVLTGIFGVDFSDSIFISVILTIVAYPFGDLLIFHRTFDHSDLAKRNITATLADIALVFVLIWMLEEAVQSVGDNLILGAFLSAIVIGVGEWFFHKFLENHILHEDRIKDRT
ncbi:DUF2512 family protein [Peribacillus sp. SCS-155]|uniref:DUF2512 family protein n=1 Tax=Peribacillus sedimenti TaxID=3115297 RepID=UPI003906C4A7